MKQGAEDFRGHGRRIVVGVVLGLAAVVALGTNDDSQAQLPGVTTPQISTPPVSLPPLTIPPVRVQVPPVSVPGTPVQTPPVTVQTPPVTTPRVQAPSVTAPTVTVPPVTAPKVSAPHVQAPALPSPSNPSAPRAPSVPSVRTPPVSGDGGLGSPSSPRQANGTGSAGPGAAGSGSGATGAARVADAAIVDLGIPSAAALRRATPARRRQLLRQAWDAPLRRAKLRHLRRTLAAYGGCLDDLPAQGRRALVLRAGLGAGKPASRRAVAHRLGVPLKRELHVESGALHRLTSAGRQGLCGGGVVVGTYGGSAGAAGGGQALAGGSTSQSGHWSAGASDARGGVLGVSEHGGAGGGASKLGFVDRTNGAPNALLLLALAILGPLGVALLATRSSRTAKPPRT